MSWLSFGVLVGGLLLALLPRLGSPAGRDDAGPRYDWIRGP